MSEENVEVIDALYEAFNRREFGDAIARYADPEIDFNPGLLPPGERTHFVGREGVMEWIGNVNDAWVAVTVEPKERLEAEDGRILSIDLWRFRGRDEIEVEEELPTVFTFRDGLIVRVDGFTHRAEALKAVGVSD